MDYITVNELIKVLSELPEDAKNRNIYSICGCRDNEVGGFQFELIGDFLGHKKYVLVPHNRNDVMHDTFGERKIINDRL